MTLTELLETQDDGPVLLLAQLLTPRDRFQMLALCRAAVHSQLRQFHFAYTNWELPASFAVAQLLVERSTMSRWIRTVSMTDASFVPLLSAFPSLQCVRIGHVAVGQAAAAEGGSAVPTPDQTAMLSTLPLVALDLRQTAIVNIANLLSLRTLKRLDLSRTQVRNISALSALPQLTHLNLEDTLVDSIACVSAMTGLLSLNINRTMTLYDITPLAHLSQLQELHANGKQVMDVEFFQAFESTLRVLELRRVRLVRLAANIGAATISSLTQLTSLVLQRCTLIKTLEPLAGLVHLQHLDISDSEFADLTPLRSLVALESLVIDTDGVQDLAPLRELHNLRQLTQNGFLSSNENNDSSSDSVLTHLPRLETLCGPMTLPGEANALPALTRLEVENYSDKELPLHIHSSPNLHTLFARGAFDLSPLPLCAPKLTQLTLSRVARVNFDAIAQLTQLELLNLSFTTSSGASLTSYAFLQPLKQLRDLRLYQHSIRDLSVLSGLSKLQALDLDSTNVEDISPLSALRELQDLDLADTNVTDVRSLCTLSRLRVVFLPPCADCEPLRRAQLPALKKVWHPTVNCLWHERHTPQCDEAALHSHLAQVSFVLHRHLLVTPHETVHSDIPDRLQTTDGVVAGACSGIGMSRLTRGRGGPPSNQHVPEGWFSVEPSSQTPVGPRRPRPQTLAPGRQSDALGLAKVTDPLAELTPRRLRPCKSKKATLSTPLASSACVRISRSVRVESASPRIVKLQQLTASSPPPAASAIVTEEDQQQAILLATAAFSPSRSLRLTCISASAKRPRPPSSSNQGSRPDIRGAQTPRQQTPPTYQVPLHEVIQSFDERVDAAPGAESNQSAITDLFLEQWLQRFESDRKLYKSTVVHAEIAFKELYGLTANLAFPNEFVTKFACKIVDAIGPHFGVYAPLMRVLASELHRSIYSPAHAQPVPYFALVNNQKRLVLGLRHEKTTRKERNALLSREIASVHSMFLTFLDRCAHGLLQTLLREWYSVAIIRKKNSKKYIEYYSAWFSGSVKKLIPKIFTAWKHYAVQCKVDKMKQQLQADSENLATLQQQIDQLAMQRDIAQVESLAVCNDRKEAEDMIQRLHRKIQSASAYLAGSGAREGIVCQEGVLRAEAVSYLPPLVLESLLRSFHNLGYLQQLHSSLLVPNSPTFQRRASRTVIQEPKTSTGHDSHLQDCLAEIIRIRTQSISTPADELSVDEFTRFFQFMKQKMEIPSANLIFTSSAASATDGVGFKGGGESQLERTLTEFEQSLRVIRAQDEHYARYFKLFSARVLESHEVSIIPFGKDIPPTEISPLDPDLSRLSDLGIINGTKRYAIANTDAVHMKLLNGANNVDENSTHSAHQSHQQASMSNFIVSNSALDKLVMIRSEDFEISPRHSRGFAVLSLAHLASEYGSLLFSPTDMSAFTHNPHFPQTALHSGEDPNENPNAKTATVAQQPVRTDQGMRHLIAAYDTWNRLSAELIAVGIVQSRGLIEPSSSNNALDVKKRLSRDESSRMDKPVDTSVLLLSSRPKLLYQLEPMPQSMLLHHGNSSFPHHNGAKNSLVIAETFHSARIRKLSLNDTIQLAEELAGVKQVIDSISLKAQDFAIARQQIQDFRLLEWDQASDLAGQFTPCRDVSASPVFGTTTSQDDRKHVYECISFDNNAIARLFSFEDHPEEELALVRSHLERKKHAMRHMYSAYRPNIQHAISLEDLWHLVKILRFPKETHMLPTLRDEEGTATGYEQVFSPDDLTEMVLQLCNEQFLPQIVPLSARVEYFTTHHLPFALQNQSIIHDLMRQPDVKRALMDHSQVLRTIFRRYCASQREVAVAASSKSHRARYGTHGNTKYMRLVDWHAFILDYHLLRARFTVDYATKVFRDAQEADSGQDELLEMIYSEFCEAIVGISACFFPDPFLKSSSKINQFIRRYLPVSPDEVRDHS